jgi:YidC/Oxa1 family membrane protein insertase
VTLMLKVAFFPLANKSYASTAKMKAVQPQIQLIRDSFANDKARQQQATLELYRKEKINPIAGCLPTLIQIPVFFSLYKVLFITIEMRQAPFFGWIRDLSAPDPSNLFNLFGLIPYDPVSLPLLGGFLMIGAWPLLMGFSQWLQMKLAPASPDPAQAAVLNWMPVIFTFMLAKFPAGLVIYWTWNNSLSVIQQSIVMRKNGVRIELWDKLRAMFAKGGRA